MSTIQHPLEQEELMAYFDNELGPDRAATAAAHLEQCEECRRFVESLRSVSRGLRAWQVETSDSRISESISRTLQASDQGSKRRLSRLVWGIVAAGLTVVMLSLVTLQMLSRYRMAPPVRLVRTRHTSAPPSRSIDARSAALVVF